MDKLLLVDGANLLFQMFYGMPARIAGADGRPIQGTLGFTGALLRMLRMTGATHAAVLFDGQAPTPRSAAAPDYKANRPDFSAVSAEENPYSQLPDIRRALDFLGIRYAEAQGCEADDLMASYARALPDDMELLLASFDSDLFQLVGERVRVLRYRGEKTQLCDAAYVEARFGVPPARYADHKALTGDRADNIPGAPGVGTKTAAALLRRFGSLEGVLAHAGELERPALRASVGKNAALLRQNLALIRLAGDAPLPFPPQALAYTDRGLATGEVLRGIGVR